MPKEDIHAVHANRKPSRRNVADILSFGYVPWNYAWITLCEIQYYVLHTVSYDEMVLGVRLVSGEIRLIRYCFNILGIRFKMIMLYSYGIVDWSEVRNVNFADGLLLGRKNLSESDF